MINHFASIFLRIAAKRKLAYLIKGIGLVVSGVMIFYTSIYVHDELIYDKFHQDVDNIYRITTISNFNNTLNRYVRTPLPLNERLTELQSIKSSARIFERGVSISNSTEQKFNETNVWFADSTLLDVLSFNAIHGGIKNALHGYAVIISEKTARKYFGKEDVVGEELLLENRVLVKIGAVVKDYPPQSSLKFSVIIPFRIYLSLENPNNVSYLLNDWIYTSVYTFIKTEPKSDIENVNNDLATLSAFIPDQRAKENITYEAQPIKDIHLNSTFRGEDDSPRKLYLIVLTTITLMMYGVSLINFISLTTTEWVAREKEISVRKFLGSTKLELGNQLLFENVLLVLFILPVIITIAYLFLPTFNNLTEKFFTLNDLLSFYGLTMVGLTLMVYILITQVSILNYMRQQSSDLLTKSVKRSMVPLTFQVTITLILSSLSIIGFKQIAYLHDKSLGFQKEAIIVVPLFSENFNSIIGQVTGDLRGRMNYFENELLKNPKIEAISCSAFSVGEGAISALTVTDQISERDNVFLALNSVDYDFIETMKIPLVAGRNFSKEYGTDHQNAFIINELAVKTLGFDSPQKAIGQNIEAVGKKGQIIGVVKDYHFEGLQNSIRPMILEVAAWKFTNFCIRLSGHEIQEGLQYTETLWNKVFPEKVFDYTFLDEKLEANYRLENNLISFTKYISVLSVILSLLGIYSFSTELARKKIKELTIRKISGAGAYDLIKKFSIPFVQVLIIGFTIASPLFYYIANSWLNTFAYHIRITPMDMIFVFFGSCGLILITLSRQLKKVAGINPVDNLRNE